jgi:hypothetical protein
VAATTSVVWVAAQFAALIDEPIPAASTAPAANISGAAIT